MHLFKKILFLGIFFFVLIACDSIEQGTKSGKKKPTIVDKSVDKPIKRLITIQKGGNTIVERFNPPTGYTREKYSNNSFQYYLQNLPLKENGAMVKYYDGREKRNNNIYAAVIDIDVGKKDLQQCADAVMRLRAEYLYQNNQSEKIHFNFTNGFNAEYKKWKEGQRIKVSGNKVNWVQGNESNNSYQSFRKYMEKVFMYAGTLSLSKELEIKDINALEIGDVFIQGGSPGHAVIVVDKAINAKGAVVFMLAQSYMPAQDIQVLQNPSNSNISPWYDLNFGEVLNTPEWKFNKTNLKYFTNE